MGVDTHYEKDGVMRSHLLNVPYVNFSHTGKNLARTLKTVTNDFGITDKVRIASLFVFCFPQCGW